MLPIVHLSDHIKCNECVQCSRKKGNLFIVFHWEFNIGNSIIILYEQVLLFGNESITCSGMKTLFFCHRCAISLCNVWRCIQSMSAIWEQRKILRVDNTAKCLWHKWSSEAFSVRVQRCLSGEILSLSVCLKKCCLFYVFN